MYALFVAKASHLEKETAFASIADSMLSKSVKQDTKEDNCQTLPRQGGQSFKITVSHKSLWDVLGL